MGNTRWTKKLLLAVLKSQALSVEGKMQAAITDMQKKKECLKYKGSLSCDNYVKDKITREGIQLANENWEETVKNFHKKILQAEKIVDF